MSRHVFRPLLPLSAFALAFGATGINAHHDSLDSLDSLDAPAILRRRVPWGPPPSLSRATAGAGWNPIEAARIARKNRRRRFGAGR